MGTIRQTKRSGNSRWMNILYHNIVQSAEGTLIDSAIELIFQNNPLGDLSELSAEWPISSGQLLWVKWTMTDEWDTIDLTLFGPAIEGIGSDDAAAFTFYDSDGTTPRSTSGSYDGAAGQWYYNLAYWGAYSEALYSVGQTYYASVLAPATGVVRLMVNVD